MCKDIWAWIVIGIMAMIVYGYLESRYSRWRKNRLREKTIPRIHEGLHTDRAYNVHLSDGRKFLGVHIMGSIEDEDAQIYFAGWEGILVLAKADGKKIYVKKSAVRYLEEA
ncbi:hypothetical protein [Nitratifractor sp.]